jgi:hypothetical protein
MITYRTNPKSNRTPSPGHLTTADESFRTMEGQAPAGMGHRSGGPPPSSPAPPAGAPPREPPPPPGDLIYGAMAIAAYLFGEANKTTRRRVFNLWSHYGKRAGFRKLKGALCLSKTRWAEFNEE